MLFTASKMTVIMSFIGTDSYVWRVNVPDEVIVNAEVWVAVVAAVAVVFSIVIIVAKITNHRSKSRKSDFSLFF